MKLCILGTALGTSDNLVINDDYFSWINYVPSDVVTLGSNKTSALSLDYVAKLFRKPIPTFGNLPHAKFFKSIGMEPHDVHWQRALDTVTYKETINEMIGGSRGLMDEYEKSGYSETLTKRLEVLSSLEKAAVNERDPEFIKDYKEIRQKHKIEKQREAQRKVEKTRPTNYGGFLRGPQPLNVKNKTRWTELEPKEEEKTPDWIEIKDDDGPEYY